MGRHTSRRVRTLLALGILLALVGCTPAGQPDAEAAARAFTGALAAGDPGRACGLLSEEVRGQLESSAAQPCAAALARLALPTDAPVSTEVWGSNAQVRTGGDTLFLAEFTAGWKVTAAGCSPRPEQPYDCRVEG